MTHKKHVLATLAMMGTLLFSACNPSESNQDAQVRLMVLDPGHFHAALVQKSTYEGVDSNVFVYAPKGPEVNAYLELVDRYNHRETDPTNWNEKVYFGADYLEKMLSEKPGNLVILAGNNLKKTDYIHRSIEEGINVLSDKPMAISADDFEQLQDAFSLAEEKGVFLYDIMTERYEIHSVLQKTMAHMPAIFGTLEKGSLEDPAVIKKSVHHFYKEVSGSPLIRPEWYYDVEQEGEGLVDVTTHLIDLIQWQCFPEETLNYQQDIDMLEASHWTTPITLEQYGMSTGASEFPEYLDKDIKDGVLQVYSNGEMNYTLKGVHSKVIVEWNFQAPEGTGDTHLSLLRGSKANLAVRQGAEQGYKPVLYLEDPQGSFSAERIEEIQQAFAAVQESYPGVELMEENGGFRIEIPEKYKVGHEAHFAQVAQKYLDFVESGTMPSWEVPNMIAKYYTTTKALEKAREASAEESEN